MQTASGGSGRRRRAPDARFGPDRGPARAQGRDRRAKLKWQAIISGRQQREIRATLADPERRTNKSARRYLLVRLVECWNCGECLVARPRRRGVSAVTAARKGRDFSGCGKTYIGAEPVEGSSRGLHLPRSTRPSSPLTLDGRDGRPAGSGALAGRKPTPPRPAGRTRDCATGSADRDDRVARGPRADRATANRRPQTARQGSPAPPSWTDCRQRAALRERLGHARPDPPARDHRGLLDHVSVDPARRGYNRFDESRLRPFWRL